MAVLSAENMSFGTVKETLILTQSSKRSDSCEIAEGKSESGAITAANPHGKKVEVTIEGYALGSPGALQALVGTTTLFTSLDTDLPKIIVKQVDADKSNADFRKISMSGTHYPGIASML